MSGADDSVFLQEDQVATRLITRADDVVDYSDVRTTDCWHAIVRGISEYLRGKVIPWDGGVSYRLLQVYEGWADPEELAMWPSACVHMEGSAQYDYASLTNQTDQLPDGQVIRITGEISGTFTVDVWCTNKTERLALAALIEDLLDPVDWMSGFRLVLPHYHNAIMTGLLESVSIIDSPESAGKRWRLASFSVSAQMSKLKLVGSVPRFDPRLDSRVYDNPTEYAAALAESST